MIVKSLESPVYYRRKRGALPGRGVEVAAPKAHTRSFDQYLLEAFHGEVVQQGDRISGKLSDMTRENLIRLSEM